MSSFLLSYHIAHILAISHCIFKGSVSSERYLYIVHETFANTIYPVTFCCNIPIPLFVHCFFYLTINQCNSHVCNQYYLVQSTTSTMLFSTLYIHIFILHNEKLENKRESHFLHANQFNSRLAY